MEGKKASLHDGRAADSAPGLGLCAPDVLASAVDNNGGRQASAGPAFESKFKLKVEASGMVIAFSRSSSNMPSDRSKCRRTVAPMSWPKVALTRSRRLRLGCGKAREFLREPIFFVCLIFESSGYEDRDICGCFRSWSCSMRIRRRPSGCHTSRRCFRRCR